MDINQACELLQIDIKNLSKELIKKQYHKLALKYHPDKNEDTSEATEKFKLLSEAYAIANDYNETGSYSREKINYMFDINKHDYGFFINSFLSTLTIKNDKIRRILFSIINTTEFVSDELLSQLSPDDIDELYSYISKYQCYFSLSSSFINKLKEMVQYKSSKLNTTNDDIIILNPNIEDIIEHNIFKLDYKGHIYFVPLWHTELYYDVSCNNIDISCNSTEGELVVKCIPDLPKHVWINEYNDIIYSITLDMNKVFERHHLEIKIGQKKWYIPISELKLRKYQTWLFKKQGISEINFNDIYDVSRKRDIIVEIYINL